ncbi:hypothetical protein AADZ90_015705 [Aestuariibius sp. 2305UL40-4]|uniref:hypothetical protein n=1 Tax=Aestuariibius violaceus TaxID=3234132 RepID=UPI00345EEDA1
MPYDHIVVHDTRLRGHVHGREGIHVIESHCERLSEIVDRIRAATESRFASGPGVVDGVPPPAGAYHTDVSPNPVPTLSILAHGVDVAQGSSDWAIQLGVECIHPGNAQAFGRDISGRITSRIRLLACNAARSEDGRATCRALAMGAGVPVFASDTVQLYSRQERQTTFGGTPITPSQVDGPHGGWINYGAWEGTVYRFDPAGGNRVEFHGPLPPASTPSEQQERDRYQVVCR